MLTKESILQFFFDKQGREYICMQHIVGCCHTPYFILKEFNSTNEYPYNQKGERLDHKLRVVLDSSFNIEFN